MITRRLSAVAEKQRRRTSRSAASFG